MFHDGSLSGLEIPETYREPGLNSTLYYNAPVPLWEEDFSSAKLHLPQQTGERDPDFRAFLRKRPELVIALSRLVKATSPNRAARSLFPVVSNSLGTFRITNKESYEAFLDILVALADGRRNFSTGSLRVFSDGKARRVVFSGYVLPGSEDNLSRIAMAALDVSHYERRHDGLRVSEDKSRRVLEFLGEAFILVDVPTGLVVEASRRAGEIAGIPAHEMQGMHLGELFREETCRSHADLFNGEGAQDVPPFEGYLRRPGAEDVHVVIRSGIITVGTRKYVISVLDPVSPGNTGEELQPQALDSARELSHREVEVLRLVSLGLTTREIGDKLCISGKTVETHRARIMEKLNIHRAPELVRYALCKGLLK